MRGRSTGQSWQIRRVIAENKELKRRVEIVVDSPRDHDTTSPTLEADDSKTDTSLIEVTPLAAKVKGRPQHVGGERECTVPSRSETSLLKAKQSFMLCSVQEGERSG